MKGSKKLQISSHLLFVYINNQDKKWRMSVLLFSSALVSFHNLYVRSLKQTHSANADKSQLNSAQYVSTMFFLDLFKFEAL